MKTVHFLDTDVVASPERRRANRYSLPLAVTVRMGKSIELETLAEDFSVTGFRVRSPVMLPVGAGVHVYCGHRPPRKATVAWQRGDQIGFHFRQMLSPGQMEAWLDA